MNTLSRDRVRQLGGLASLVSLLAVAGTARAQVPDEFLGKWTSDPPRCEQANGEVDVLEVTKSGFGFYEIDCALAQPRRKGNAVTFSAQCAKGGIPASAGSVILRHAAPNGVSVALAGFSWITKDPFVFQRCTTR